jgi:hypothetical protein
MAGFLAGEHWQQAGSVTARSHGSGCRSGIKSHWDGLVFPANVRAVGFDIAFLGTGLALDLRDISSYLRDLGKYLYSQTRLIQRPKKIPMK